MFGVNLVTGQEPWVGRMFDVRSVEMMGGAQLYGWLNIQSNLSTVPFDLLRSGESLSGKRKILFCEPHLAARFQAEPEDQRDPGCVRPPGRRPAGLYRQYSQFPHQLPDQQALRGARHRPVRQLAGAGFSPTFSDRTNWSRGPWRTPGMDRSSSNAPGTGSSGIRGQATT